MIGAAIEVQKILGPGLLESLYEQALSIEFSQLGILHERQVPLIVNYKNQPLGEFRPDLVIENRLLVELKAIDRIAPEHEAQVLGYLRLSGLPLALLINFNAYPLTRGIRRYILSSAGNPNISPSAPLRLSGKIK